MKRRMNMDKEFTEIICVIDRSGSMGMIRDDAIGGFNTFLEEQQKLPGTAYLTFAQFDTGYEIVHENMPLQDVPVLNNDTYIPRGGTALLDAVGMTINRVGKRLATLPEEERPAKVIMAILTDGEENSSREYSLEKVKGMIEHQEKKYSWEVLFLGANQDAFAEAAKIGVKLNKTVAFAATGQGVRTAYQNMSNLSAQYRTK